MSPLRSDDSQDDQAGEGWSGRAIPQPRPRVSKLGLKRPSDYHSNEIAVEAARAELKGYSHKESAQGDKWTTALELTELGQKAARWKNTSLFIRKRYSVFLGAVVKTGVADDDDNDDK